jgi:hypothetical protein
MIPQRAVLRWLGLTALLGFCLGGAMVRGAAPVAGQVVRFTVFGLRPAGDVAFTPKAGAAPQKLRFYPTARSPRYEYRGTMPLRFVDPETNAVIAEVTVPPGAGEVLLVFAPAAEKGSGARRSQVTVVEDSFARHPAGTLTILNLSGLTLAGIVNDRAVTPEAGLNAPLPAGRSAAVRLTTTVRGRVVQSYAGTTALGRDERALLVLFPPFNPGSVEVQGRLLVDKPASTATAPARKR